MHDEVLTAAGADGVLEGDVGDRLLGERSADEEIAVAFDVMHLHPRIAKPPESIEHLLHRGGVELRMGDQIVKEISVEVEGAGPQDLEAVEPGDDGALAPGGESDVRVANDEDLAGGDHAPSPEGISREIPRPAKRGEGGRRPGEGRCITARSSD